MFVYNKQKSQRDKGLKSQSIESTMLKQVGIDASKIQRVKMSRKNTESKTIIEAINRNVNEKIKFYMEIKQV